MLLSQPCATISVATAPTGSGLATASPGTTTVRDDSGAKRAELESLLGPLPPIRPHFAAILTVARELIEMEGQATSSPVRTLPVKARKVLDRIAADLDELGIAPPTATGSDLWPAMQGFGTDTLGAWSLGHWHRPV